MFIVDWAMKRLIGICQIKDHWSEAETERFVRLSPSICSPRSAQNDRGSWIKSIPTLFTILAEKWYRSWYYRWYRTKVSVNDCCRRDHWGIVYKSVATISELIFVFLFFSDRLALQWFQRSSKIRIYRLLFQSTKLRAYWILLRLHQVSFE